MSSKCIIYEFSTGLLKECRERKWVSRGFTGEFGDANHPVPQKLKRALHQDRFEIAELLNSRQVAVILREIDEYSVLAVGTRVSDHVSRSFFAYRYFWLKKSNDTNIDGFGTLLLWWLEAGEPHFEFSGTPSQPQLAQPCTSVDLKYDVFQIGGCRVEIIRNIIFLCDEKIIISKASRILNCDGLSDLKPAKVAQGLAENDKIINVNAIWIHPTDKNKSAVGYLAIYESVSMVIFAEALSDKTRDSVPEDKNADKTRDSLSDIEHTDKTRDSLSDIEPLVAKLISPSPPFGKPIPRPVTKPITSPVGCFCLFFFIIIGLLAGVIYNTTSSKLMTYPKKSVFFLLDLSGSTSNARASYPNIVGNYIKESKILYNPINSGVIYFSDKAKFHDFPTNKSSDNARYNQTLVQYTARTMPIVINDYCQGVNLICGEDANLDAALGNVFNVGCNECEIVLISDGELDVDTLFWRQKFHDNNARLSFIALEEFIPSSLKILVKESQGSILYLESK